MAAAAEAAAASWLQATQQAHTLSSVSQGSALCPARRGLLSCHLQATGVCVSPGHQPPPTPVYPALADAAASLCPIPHLPAENVLLPTSLPSQLQIGCWKAGKQNWRKKRLGCSLPSASLPSSPPGQPRSLALLPSDVARSHITLPAPPAPGHWQTVIDGDTRD